MLRQSCADLALWIITWRGAQTGLSFCDDHDNVIGSVLGYVLTLVHYLPDVGDMRILLNFLDDYGTGNCSVQDLWTRAKSGSSTRSGLSVCW